MIKHLHPSRDSDWLEKALLSIRHLGIAVIEGALDTHACEAGIAALESARSAIAAEISEETLLENRRRGGNELRLVLKHHPFFLELLENPVMLAALDATLGAKAVLRFQNGEILGCEATSLPPLKQTTYHMNTPRVVAGSLLSIDAAFLLTPFKLAVSPGTHQQSSPPPMNYLQWAEEIIDAPAGSILVFDSTLWHREVTCQDAVQKSYIVEQQFTKSYIKPHFDFPRALGETRMLALPERTRQLLGWHTRLPTSLAEFYLPDADRLYRADQG